jgi:hypothetical protein
VVQKGWRWTQWTLLLFIAVAYMGVLCSRETYKKTILKRRANKMGREMPNVGPTGIVALRYLIMVTLTRPIHMLFTEPIVIFLSIWVAFNFATVYCFFVAFPLVFTEVYGFSAEQDGLTFVSIVVGSVRNFLHHPFSLFRHTWELKYVPEVGFMVLYSRNMI